MKSAERYMYGRSWHLNIFLLLALGPSCLSERIDFSFFLVGIHLGNIPVKFEFVSQGLRRR